MKHIKTVNEWGGQEFITGRGPGGRDVAKTRIDSEIESAIEEYNNNPGEFMKYDEFKLRDKLIQDAKEDNFRGSVVVRKSPNDSKAIHSNLKFIVYEPKMSQLQDLGAVTADPNQLH